MKLLKKILDTLPLSQRRAITATAAELERTGNLHRARAPEKRRELQSKVEENPTGPTFIPVKAVPGTRIMSETWNGMQERLYSDLFLFYDQLGVLGGTLADQSKITLTSFIATRLVILKLIEQVRVYQFLKENPEYQDVRFLSFLDGRNESAKRLRAVVDPLVNKVELDTRSRTELQSQNVDLRTTEVITRHFGGGLSGGFSKEFKPANMLDSNPETFWGELILKDSPTRFAYTPSWGVLQANGIVGEIDINMHRAERINNIRLLPFADFPVRVIDVAYRENVTDEGWVTVPGFELGKPTLDYIEIDFPPIHVASIRIALEQANYTRHVYHLPEKLVNNVALWEQVLDKEYDRILHQVDLDPADLNFVNAEPEGLAWLNALDIASDVMMEKHLDLRRATLLDTEKNQLQSLGTVLSETDPSARTDISEPVGDGPVADSADRVEVAKFEYVYGLRFVEINNVLYSPSGHFSSVKLSPGATILDVELDVEEEHVSFDDDFGPFRRTSIEYEIETGQNRRFPIHPGDDPKVLDETIFIDRRTRKGVTRFPVDSVAVLVRKNGVRMNVTEYTFLPDSVTGFGVLTIGASYFDANAAYTVTYYAAESARKFSLRGVDSTALLNPEEHTETDRDNRLQLNYYPYVEYAVINDTGEWTRDDAIEARWRFVPAVANRSSIDGSQAELISGVDVIRFTESIGELTGYDELYFRVSGDTTVHPVSPVDETGVQLTSNWDGTTTGIGYMLGAGTTVDGQLYTLDENLYEPITVFVNDQKAQNVTRYEDFEHPAFIPGESGRRLQFIHSGRNLFFSGPITEGKIEVNYHWLTQYLRLNAMLRSNFPIRTEVTPKLVSGTLKLKTTRL